VSDAIYSPVEFWKVEAEMTPFWIGFVWFVVGMFVGANVGMLVLALCKISASADMFGKKDDSYYG
jgi:hypothetical protein